MIRFRVGREPAYEVNFNDEVYGPQSKLTADIEDFALLLGQKLIEREKAGDALHQQAVEVANGPAVPEFEDDDLREGVHEPGARLDGFSLRKD